MHVLGAAGLPAKYRHPDTGTPYATLEAFAQIERHAGRLHAAGRPSAKRRYDGDSGSGMLGASEQVMRHVRCQQVRIVHLRRDLTASC